MSIAKHIKCTVILTDRKVVIASAGALMGEYNPTMSIFLMKNNFGYVDKTEQEVVVNEKTKAEKLSDSLFGDDN